MLSLLLVNYRTAALAIEAIRTARGATASALQVVVVDNSCDPAEAEALRPHADVLIVSSTNRGYAGAINDGRPKCEGEVLVVCNPDVTFGGGSIDSLAGAIGSGVAVAGPALFWDAGMRWLLPPAERMTATEKLDEVLASRSPAWLRARDRRRIRQRAAFWALQETTRVESISGAVMAIRAADFDRFDERFALYFEETDFLRRLAERHLAIAYVPSARCRHVYNQSAGQVWPEAAARYLESETKYLAKWNGPFVARLLKSLERPLDRPQPLPAEAIALPRDGLIVEASPTASFATAAGYIASHGERRVAVPDDIRNSFRGSALYLRAVDPTSGEVLATASVKMST
jgi:GT2 family glycosyltransferase